MEIMSGSRRLRMPRGETIVTIRERQIVRSPKRKYKLVQDNAYCLRPGGQ